MIAMLRMSCIYTSSNARTKEFKKAETCEHTFRRSSGRFSKGHYTPRKEEKLAVGHNLRYTAVMKTRLGVIFGSRSVEHEVSIITACQLMKHVDREKYEVIPIYISKEGQWLTGSRLEHIETFKHLELVAQNAEYPLIASADTKTSKELTTSHAIQASLSTIDVAIVCCHGTLGEDGTVQGLLELANIPYQGPGVVGSSIAMDKIITKKVLEASSFKVANFQWFTSSMWKEDKKNVLQRLLDPKNQGHKQLSFPLFVKPANLGSSVGITKAKNEKELEEAIEIATHFDRRIIIEQGLENVIEINVSVLGFEEYKASVPEQPIATGEILSYADKYEGGGKKTGGMASLKRRIPAPIPMSLTKKVQELAIHVARTCDCSGVIRIDFFVNPETDEIWVGEINTIPGSMAFYLWEASGVSYPQLIDELVAIAQKRKAIQQSFTRSISTTIIT
ncbi:D-alanine--D-alanine ligase [Candidatus Cerribacteria bacterium 'Amazon FNV 2010 28 9']|uniref:D-alanine--D-alanine ligase n=1 Tax=Candidatus Cerribacteria bacterium 'Amazon FNV 2010 28 9' TaxID=2081795 RepID=A0A317JRH0_9BACT|nr:MAG: D-alanine--D-alanine ligase [Candidatus Cerribacteria bacterium 'Amazon FNV 2010 28 9']